MTGRVRVKVSHHLWTESSATKILIMPRCVKCLDFERGIFSDNIAPLQIREAEKTSNNNLGKLWPLKKENKQTMNTKSISSERLQVGCCCLNLNTV